MAYKRVLVILCSMANPNVTEGSSSLPFSCFFFSSSLVFLFFFSCNVMSILFVRLQNSNNSNKTRNPREHHYYVTRCRQFIFTVHRWQLVVEDKKFYLQTLAVVLHSVKICCACVLAKKIFRGTICNHATNASSPLVVRGRVLLIENILLWCVVCPLHSCDLRTRPYQLNIMLTETCT